MPIPAAVQIREVGPRDGLQSETPVSPRLRARLANTLFAAGCARVEAASFVSERAVPAMAGAAEVIAEIERVDGTVLTALVPNLRGAELALGVGVDELTVTVAASPTYNERNVRRSIDESVTEIARVVRAASSQSTPVDAVVSCAFGSPYEAEIPPSEVAHLASRVLEAGVSAVTLADTTGVATPRTLRAVLDECVERMADLRPGLHLHETRGTAMLNAYVAMEAGVTRFDSSIGGLGGSPFATGAGGNLASEDFVALLDELGVESGIRLAELLEAARMAREIVGHELPSKVRASSSLAPK